MYKGTIYVITNTVNNKIYIGQTIQTLNGRISGHVCDSKRYNTYLCNSIKKYGKEKFTIQSIFLIEEETKEKRDQVDINGNMLNNLIRTLNDKLNRILQ